MRTPYALKNTRPASSPMGYEPARVITALDVLYRACGPCLLHPSRVPLGSVRAGGGVGVVYAF